MEGEVKLGLRSRMTRSRHKLQMGERGSGSVIRVIRRAKARLRFTINCNEASGTVAVQSCGNKRRQLR